MQVAPPDPRNVAPAHPQNPQPETNSFQWLIDLFKSILDCLCCCFSQDDRPSLDGRVVTTTVEEVDSAARATQSTLLVQEPDDDAPTPITTGALVPVSQRHATISGDSGFDQLKKFCPIIGEWLQADHGVNLSINYAMSSTGSFNFTAANYSHLSEKGCKIACQNLIDKAKPNLGKPNFKYCIEVTVSKIDHPSESVTFAWQNVKRQGRALSSGAEPALLTHESTSSK